MAGLAEHQLPLSGLGNQRRRGGAEGLRQRCDRQHPVDLCVHRRADRAPHYATAKAALLAYNKGIAQEFAPHGVRVNAITPGSVATPGGTEVLQSIADAFGASIDALSATIPLGRRGDSRDIAEMITFLSSNRSQWIAGANFMVTGGANGGQ